MKIEITEGFPQQKESSLSLMNPWMMKHHLFARFYDEYDEDRIGILIEDAEQARELAQELKHCYNKLIHWAEKQEEREE